MRIPAFKTICAAALLPQAITETRVLPSRLPSRPLMTKPNNGNSGTSLTQSTVIPVSSPSQNVEVVEVDARLVTEDRDQQGVAHPEAGHARS